MPARCTVSPGANDEGTEDDMGPECISFQWYENIRHRILKRSRKWYAGRLENCLWNYAAYFSNWKGCEPLHLFLAKGKGQ
jgi:hypothetical protein